MAEAFYNNFSGKKSAISAGIHNIGENYDFLPRKDIIRVMKEKNIDISSQNIKQVSYKCLQNTDKIIVLCDPKLLPPFVRNAGINISINEIKDPYKSSLKELRAIRDEIEELVLKLLGEL